MSDVRPISPVQAALWLAVTRVGAPMTIREYRGVPQVAAILRAHHTNLRSALDYLVHVGHLRRSKNARFHELFWFSDECAVPDGLEAPVRLPAGAEKASTRSLVNAAMPKDTTPLMQPMSGAAFDFRKWPSRRGDRLHYADGRITDMEGNPV